MASNDFCESCFGKGQSTVAEKLCTDCDEKLCEECGCNHLVFESFKSHHVIQLTSIPANICTFPKYCSVHEDLVLDFYCTYHSTTCCRRCIRKTHKCCTDVLPLEIASKSVEKSTLYEEAVTELNNIICTLENLFQDRESNLKKIRHSASLIKKKIAEFKQRLLKQIDDLEYELTKTLNAIKTNLEAELNKTKHDVTEKMTKTKHIKEEFDFLRSNNSNKQLFLALHKHNQDINTLETEITEMIPRCEKTNITFKHAILDIRSLGTISEKRDLIDIQYKPSKLKQAQEKSEPPPKPLTTFRRQGILELPRREDHNITDIAVGCDKKVFLCNYHERCPKIYILSEFTTLKKWLTFSNPPRHIAIIPGTSKAVVTLPGENSIQFINTVTITKEDKMCLEFSPWGITASPKNIFMRRFGKVYVFDTKGIFQKEIRMHTTDREYVPYLSLNKGNTEFLCSTCTSSRWSFGAIYCIDLYGYVRYRYSVSNPTKIAIDGQGDVYVGDYNKSEIHRLSPNGKLKDVILTKEDDVLQPRVLQFNNDFTQLFILNDNGSELLTFVCS